MVNEITPTQAAWLAGFVDGEGCFVIYRQSLASKRGREESRGLGITVRIANTFRPALEHIQAALGCGSIVKVPKGPRHKQGWAWCVSGRPAQELAAVLRPYLQVKQQQAELFAQWPFWDQREGKRVPPELIEVREGLFSRMTELNRRGEPLA